jgi:hypothetical protein
MKIGSYSVYVYYIHIQTLFISLHLDQPTSQQPSQLTRVWLRALNRVYTPWSSRLTPHATQPNVTQPFSIVAQSFYYIVSHLLQWTPPFCFNELSHFATVNPAILLQWTKSFCQSFSRFSLYHFATVNSTIFLWYSVIFWLLQCPVVSHCYSAQSFFVWYLP